MPVIEIRLSNLDQLFNSLDPSPFHEKDLDADAEEYITGAVDDFPLTQPLKIAVYLPPEQIARIGADGLAESIHHYFAYTLDMGRRKLRFSFREGRFSLLIGLAFLVLCVSLRELVRSLDAGTLGDIAAEGLLISGWVAMWRPMEIFLYDWWPIRAEARLSDRLSSMPVRIAMPGSPPGS